MVILDTAVMPTWLFVLLIIWIIPWKAIALWKSARNNQLIWFIVLLIVNTLGILEILYLALSQKDKNRRKRK